ncbi:hypothetical protein H6784_03010 [Candidatus Nomurabacteria bacterium]|nr:hypothetical protein [Candidatus Kaiserbacteria bacterium]MCB9814363.1 hypothetical protein [Candidatus Nomurabacteria bacterium]
MSLSGLGPFGARILAALQETRMPYLAACELAALLDQAAVVHERKALERLS